MARLVDVWPSPGRKEVSFKAAGFASGTYFMRLHANEKVLTRKLVIVQ